MAEGRIKEEIGIISLSCFIFMNFVEESDTSKQISLKRSKVTIIILMMYEETILT